MPTPRSGEKKDAFISRCMGDAEARRDFPEGDQRFAVCNSIWERARDGRRAAIAPGEVVQGLLVHRARYATLRAAQGWAEENGYAASTPAPSGRCAYLFPQRPTEDFVPGSLRTVLLDDGVEAVVGTFIHREDCDMDEDCSCR